MTKERDLELANVSHLTTNRSFRNAVAETLKKWPKGLKGDVWDAMVQRMLEAVEVIEPGHPDHPSRKSDVEETEEWLGDYLDANKVGDEEEASMNSAPFSKDGVPYIFLHHFSEWISISRGEKYTSHALANRLRDTGWEKTKVRMGEKTPRVWRPGASSSFRRTSFLSPEPAFT